MRKQIITMAAMICIGGILLSGCGSKSKAETNASAGELISRETSEEIATSLKANSNEKEKKTEKESTSKVDSTTTRQENISNETTESVTKIVGANEQSPQAETQAQVPQPQTEAPTQAPQSQIEVSAQAPQPQTEAPTQVLQPQTEASTQAPQPQTEAPTQAPEPQKTQEEYLQEFKQKYVALRQQYGYTSQWSDELYQIAKKRADEIVGYNFGHESPSGLLNGLNIAENIYNGDISQAWNAWCDSSEHYANITYPFSDIYAVAYGKGGCVFLSGNSDVWCAEAYANQRTEAKIKELKTYAINNCGANEKNWKKILEDEVLWLICKDENGNERFDITYDIAIKEFWQAEYDWYTQQYGERIVR